jgi:hypothetical protein
MGNFGCGINRNLKHELYAQSNKVTAGVSFPNVSADAGEAP